MVQKAAVVLFNHENAPPYRAACVHQFFDDNNFEVVSQALYSTDLAPLMNFDGFHATQVEESRAILRK
jgi:hypothetical protein